MLHQTQKCTNDHLQIITESSLDVGKVMLIYGGAAHHVAAVDSSVVNYDADFSSEWWAFTYKINRCFKYAAVFNLLLTGVFP